MKLIAEFPVRRISLYACDFGDSPNQVALNVSSARTALSDEAGFKMAVIDTVPECAWFSQLAGNFNMRPREAYLTSLNFSALSPFHNFARGKRDGNPWGEALALFKTQVASHFTLIIMSALISKILQMTRCQVIRVSLEQLVWGKQP